MAQKITGVTYHGDSAGNPYPLMKSAGIGWIRTDIPCWRDRDACYHCGQAGCPSECGWGLVRVDESPKPGLAAFRSAMERYSG